MPNYAGRVESGVNRNGLGDVAAAYFSALAGSGLAGYAVDGVLRSGLDEGRIAAGFLSLIPLAIALFHGTRALRTYDTGSVPLAIGEDYRQDSGNGD